MDLVLIIGDMTIGVIILTDITIGDLETDGVIIIGATILIGIHIIIIMLGVGILVFIILITALHHHIDITGTIIIIIDIIEIRLMAEGTLIIIPTEEMV